jgi:hypothetical protein
VSSPSPDLNHHSRWRQWTGYDFSTEMMGFLRQQPDLIWWAEQELTGGATLALSYELSSEHPIRVPPGWWLWFDGRRISAFERRSDGG